MIGRSLILVVFALFSNIAVAGDSDQKQLAEQVLDTAGFYEVIASFPDQVNAQAAQQSPFSTDQALTQKVVEMLVSSFDENKAKAYMLEYALKNASADELGKILQWINSPLGAKIMAAEMEAGTVEGQANLMRYAADLSTNPPSEERIVLIQEFEEKAQLTKNVLEMMATMMMGVARGINSVAPASERLLNEEVEGKMNEIIGNMMPLIEQMMWQQMLVTAHYMYREFSTEEIRRYIDFLQTQEGQTYISLGKGIGEVFGRIMSDAMINMVKNAELKELL